jgi:chitinase
LWKIPPVSPVDGSVWKPNSLYKLGNIVTYSGSSYTCLNEHTSILSWEPTAAHSLWKLSGSAPVVVAPVVNTPVVVAPVPKPVVVAPVPKPVVVAPVPKPVVVAPVVNTPSTKKRAIYYHANWSTYARNYQIKDIPEQVTDISYAFFNIDASGNVSQGDAWADTGKRFQDGVPPQDSWNDPEGRFYGNFGQIKKIQNSGRKLDVSLSVGGWTWSANFSPAVSTQTNRTNFVNSVIAIFKQYTVFSGISIDWEYVSNDGINYGNAGNKASKEDSANLALFLVELRNAFKNNGMANYTIAMCTIADPDKCKFDLETIHPLLDELHIMTYDFHDGNWGEKITRFQSNPRKSDFSNFSCEEAADYYLSRGVPSTKLFIGVAFYSRGYSNTEGIGKSASGGSSDLSWDKGSVDYKNLPLPGATEYTDPISKAAYSYDPVKKIINTYDNPASVIEKCKIIYEKNLGGCIVWESSADAPYSHPRSLMRTLYENLTNGKPDGVVPVTAPVVVAPVESESHKGVVKVQSGKTILAPYCYNWSRYHVNSYKIPTLVDGYKKIGLSAATFAFVTSDGGQNFSGAVQENMQDMIDFVKLGGHLIISCGGASSPWIEATMSVDRMVELLTDLFKKTGAKGLDLDVEGTALHNTSDVDKLNKAVAQVQKNIPGLYVSYTIPVGDPQWESIEGPAQSLLGNAIKNGVNINVVNMMLMDLYGDYTKRPRWGDLAIQICENAKNTLKRIFSDRSDGEIYRTMGLCPMLGIQDDLSVFGVEDARILARYAKEKNVGLYSGWAMQRDQIGNVDLNLHSKVNTVDFEFYNAVKEILYS